MASKKLRQSQWELVLPEILLLDLSSALPLMPRLAKTLFIPTVDTLYLAGSVPGPVLVHHHVHASKYNPQHTYIQYVDECESTVSICDLALTGDT